MCKTITINIYPYIIDSVKEFKEYFNVELDNPDGCLCDVDVDSILQELNIDYEQENEFDYKLKI